MENKKQFDGLAGLALDAIFRTSAKKAPAGKSDARLANGKHLEIKSGSGALKYEGVPRALYGSTVVLYIPVPVWHNGHMKPASSEDYIDLREQEGFLLPREAFLNILETAGAIRRKAIHGSIAISIQSFYNRTTDKPHGRLYSRLLDRLYNEAMPLEDALEAGLLRPWQVHTVEEVVRANSPEGLEEERVQALCEWIAQG